ncbi:MAG: 4Fe-4S binding protein [Coriobacteriia bacterium]|nr:4Fe-4S binding protein [Coriobacteriia bacterium]MBS5477589.1 4Fe-4S binding protein [Coriobacteriia bacterium]
MSEERERDGRVPAGIEVPAAEDRSTTRTASKKAAGGRRRKKKASGVQTLRSWLPWIVMGVVAVGFVTTWGIGTLSGLGWGELTALCPLGAITTMLASKLLVPRALISIAIAVVIILLVGRAFCGWVCPVPAVGRLRELFAKKPARKRADAAKASGASATAACETDGGAQKATGLSAVERRAIKRQMRGGCAAKVRELRGSLDSRHVVLGGALVSALAFGFPVFCLICPIGLTFATILLVIRAFGMGDVSIALLVVPLMLIAEVVLFRKWCHRICPVGALMSLIARANRTARPVIDDAKCIETAKGKTCGACARACGEGIDLRHLELGSEQLNECVRCHKCVEACPAHAVSMPLLARKNSKGAATPQAPIAE